MGSPLLCMTRYGILKNIEKEWGIYETEMSGDYFFNFPVPVISILRLFRLFREA